jgi:hypothetical protein
MDTSEIVTLKSATHMDEFTGVRKFSAITFNMVIDGIGIPVLPVLTIPVSLL